MNLYDLVRRRDRALDLIGSVRSVELARAGGAVRAVRFAAGSRVRVRAAHEASYLGTFPSNPSWSIVAAAGDLLEISVEYNDTRFKLGSASGSGSSTESPIVWRWPVPVPLQFDLTVETRGSASIDLIVGPLFNPRASLLPMLQGAGVEVGPGLNPSVLPSASLRVEYVEKKHPKDWAATYAKRELTAAEMALWDLYVVDSARFLTGYRSESLNFVFSSHVLEHLVDPIGTLIRWWRKLAPGGVIAGVVPDARFTFDWRQPRYSLADVRSQYGLESDEPTEEMYARWCRYTSPENTPESLRARNYSIHVSYLTPELMREILDEVAARVDRSGGAPVTAMYLESVPNGKDFGFLISKAA
jgi:SAM-dependent methyltransferase